MTTPDTPGSRDGGRPYRSECKCACHTEIGKRHGMMHIQPCCQPDPMSIGSFNGNDPGPMGGGPDPSDGAVEAVARAIVVELLKQDDVDVEADWKLTDGKLAWLDQGEVDMHAVARVAIAAFLRTTPTPAREAESVCPTCDETNAAFFCSDGFHHGLSTVAPPREAEIAAAAYERAAKVAWTAYQAAYVAYHEDETPANAAASQTAFDIFNAIRALGGGMSGGAK